MTSKLQKIIQISARLALSVSLTPWLPAVSASIDRPVAPHISEESNALSRRTIRSAEDPSLIDGDPDFPSIGTVLDRKHLALEGSNGFGMASASIFTHVAELNVFDIPLKYKTAIGPEMNFRINYNAFEAERAVRSAPRVSSLGPGWSLNWVAYLVFDESKNVKAFVPGGGYERYLPVAPAANATDGTDVYAFNPSSFANLVQVGKDNYERRLADGTVEVYALKDQRGRLFMTKLIDPHKNAAQIVYDSKFRVVSIADTAGLVSKVKYLSDASGSPDFYRIAQIADPFGRQAKFSYDPTDTFLSSSTDSIGLVSKFKYNEANGFLTSMSTPYGYSSFTSYVPKGSSKGSRGLACTMPDGTQEVAEHWTGTVKKSYFWNREAMRISSTDPDKHIYSHCEITSWASDPQSGAELSLIESTKRPLEGPVNYTYESKTETGVTRIAVLPSKISREIQVTGADGTISNGVQANQYKYNRLGFVTEHVDPLGRVTHYKYAENGIDLIEQSQDRNGQKDRIESWQYNEKRCPIVHIDGSGQKTIFEYNDSGELTKLVDANRKEWSFKYDAGGRILTISAPSRGTLAQFSYDQCGRLKTSTDANGYSVAYEYDDADRVIQVAHPDGTTEKATYDKLQLSVVKDRLGHSTKRTYDSLEKLAVFVDAAGKSTHYNWCACGSMHSLVDPNGHVSRWEHDERGRVTEAIFADGRSTKYEYEPEISRIKSRTDSLNQVTTYCYYADDSLAKTTYTSAIAPTSSVIMTYDQNYPRLKSIQNGAGTIAYEYVPFGSEPGNASLGSGNLGSVTFSGNGSTSVSYKYDQSGLLTNSAIQGSNYSDAVQYDEFGRVMNEANPLGQFRFKYAGGEAMSPAELMSIPGSSSRVDVLDPWRLAHRNDNAISEREILGLSEIAYPNGQVSRFSTTVDGTDTLRQISNLRPNASVLSQLAYRFNQQGELTSSKREVDGKFSDEHQFKYDRARHLTADDCTGVDRSGSNRAINRRYEYDAAGNRTLSQAGESANKAIYSSTNELLILKNGVSKKTCEYDANGNLTSDLRGNKYHWDAENRLVQIDYPGVGNSTKFVYDGLGQCVKETEIANDKIVANHQIVWSLGKRIEVREAGKSQAVAQLYPLGEVKSGRNFFYTLDNLLSTREMTDEKGELQARYDYDPYGRVTTEQESVPATAQYAGYTSHPRSGLNLTTHRGYSPELGRWLNRDPLGLRGGVNLYAYLASNPLAGRDPSGLQNTVPSASNGMNPGLYVQVLDGMINVSNGGGTQNFTAGQFGYTPSFQQPPVILPSNPGLQFTPPPSFSSTTGSAGAAGGKPGDVDCQVR